MKKTILALTIPALFATSASAVEIYSAEDGSKVDLYGRLQYHAGGMGYQDDKGDKEAKRENFGGEGQVRLGINLKQVLNDDIALIGKYEANFDAESKTNRVGSGKNNANNEIDTRYAWLGFNFQDTTDVKFGRSDTAWTQFSDLTDTFDIFGTDVTLSNGPTSRADDQLAVSYADNGLDLRAAYSFDDSNKQDGSRVDGGDGQRARYGASAGYTLPMGLGFVAAYERQSGLREADLPETFKGHQDSWGVGAHYTIDGFYFAGLYGQKTLKLDTNIPGQVGTIDVGTKFYEVLGAYNVDAWTLQASYAKEKGRKAASDERETSAYTFGTRYAITPKAKVYAEYVINNEKQQDDLYGVGIQYNF